jgi:thiol:disulfide interchange protein DsbA
MSPLSKTRNNRGKTTMRLIHTLLLSLALLGATATAAAAPEAPANGREYQTLEETQPTEAGNKIEVTEFFAYSCPHCHAFEPSLAAWVKKNADKVVFKRVHVAFRAPDDLLQRLYVTLETMNITEQNHNKLFEEIHVKRNRMSSEEAIFEWAAKAGLDRAKLTSIYRSFGTQAKVNRAQAMTAAYKIAQWPLVAVDGRFITSPYKVATAVNPPLSEADGQQGSLKVMDFLVAKALAEKK